MMTMNRTLVLTLLGSLLPTIASAAPGDFELLLTADIDGRLAACSSCGGESAEGGLAKTAGIVERLRQSGTDFLRLDAGNLGLVRLERQTDGRASQAVDESGLQVLNVCFRDFRFGKSATLQAIREAKLPAISANVQDARTGELLLPPYQVVRVGTQRVGVLGVTANPRSVQVAPHLKQQLTGLNIRAPRDAINQVVSQLDSQCDCIVLLYYGTISTIEQDLNNLPDPITAIAVGGVDVRHISAALRKKLLVADPTAGTVASARVSGNELRIASALALSGDVEAAPERVALVKDQGTVPSREPTRRDDGSEPTPAPTVAVAFPTPSHRTTALGQDERQQLGQSIAKAQLFLWRYLQKRAKSRSEIGDDDVDWLVALALVRSAAHYSNPEMDRMVRNLLSRGDLVFANERMATYRIGVACMLADAYGDPTYAPLLQSMAQFLVDSQCADGSWQYGAPTNAYFRTAIPINDRAVAAAPGVTLKTISDATFFSPPQSLQRSPPTNQAQLGDNSLTQFAILGLHAATRRGIVIPTDTWQRADLLFRSRQTENGGWAYRSVSTSRQPYGSMTCAALCSLAIIGDRLQQGDPGKNANIQRGWKWLVDRFTVEQNPHNDPARDFDKAYYYYLYSLERVGRMLDQETIGGRSWFRLGSHQLVTTQAKDGSWRGKSDREGYKSVATSFALLFLARSTPRLSADSSDDGSLIVVANGSVTLKLYIVFDSSGSMRSGQPVSRLDIARTAVLNLVRQLPDEAEVALRVYGSKKPTNEKMAARNSRLLLPMRPLNAAQRRSLERSLAKLNPEGNTPLRFALDESSEDIRRVPKEHLVHCMLITDGGADTDPLAAARRLSQHDNARISVVGFQVANRFKAQLESLVESGRGKYLAANQLGTLTQSLQAAAAVPPDSFDLLNHQGHVIQQGKIGERLSLPPGRYTVSFFYLGQTIQQQVQVGKGTQSIVVLSS